MNRNRYTYNPIADEPELTSVWCIKVSQRLFSALCETLEHASNLSSLRLDEVWRDGYYQEALDFCGVLVKEILRIPRSYYDLWMIRAMLRAVVFAYLGIDFDKGYAYQNQNKVLNYLHDKAMGQFAIPIELFGNPDASSANAIRLWLDAGDNAQS